MKTLSEKQPWAYLICAGIKPIENRTWKLPEKYKGQRVLIHASAKNLLPYGDWSNRIPLHPLSIEQKESLNGEQILSLINEAVTTSAIIGSVEIVDCVQNHPSIWAEHGCITFLDKFRNVKTKPIYNWVLANPILFDEPILNMKGKLSFWDYEGELPEEPTISK